MVKRGSGSWGFLGPALGASGGQFLSFLEAVAVGFDVDDLGAVDEAIDEGDDTGGVGEDLVPLGEGLVGAEQNRLAGVVAPRDDLEEEVGVAAIIGQVPDLVDAEKMRHGVSSHATGETGG